MIKKVYLDMDGVLADFSRAVESHPKWMPNMPDNEFWDMIISIPNFWIDLYPCSGALEILSMVSSLEVKVEILTAPSKSDLRCYEGKIKWTQKYGINYDVNFAKAHYKHKYAKPNYLLIDDNESNINSWIKAGGHGILHTSLESTLKQIKELK